MAHGFESEAEKRSRKAAQRMLPAIIELETSLDTMVTNEPINRREGNIAQADLERDNARSFRSAIRVLGKRNMKNG